MVPVAARTRLLAAGVFMTDRGLARSIGLDGTSGKVPVASCRCPVESLR